MFKKIGWAAMAAFLLSGITGCDQQREVTGLAMPEFSRQAIPKISCLSTVGTAVAIAPKELLTANHVMTGGCKIAADRSLAARGTRDNELTITRIEGTHDFAVIESRNRVTNRVMPWSCEGIKTGETYWMAGYARGGPLEINEGIALDYYINGIDAVKNISTNHLRAIRGTVDHGMSGGPVINKEGQVVAIISAMDSEDHGIAMVKELKDTEMCRVTPQP